MLDRRQFLAAAAASATVFSIGRARAADAPGVSAKEIKIGQTMPYSGPASAYGVIGKTEAAYFKMVNEQGGVNGRMINLISLDDGYSPPKTVEQVRRLVEQEQVAFLWQCLGTAPCLAIRRYCNDKKIPELMCSSGSSALDDPEHFPWTSPANPIYLNEGRIYAKYILKSMPQAKIAVLYQNDGFGKDYLRGLKDVLGADHAGMIAKEASYETTEPTVDSQVTSLQGSGADVLIIAATPKFAAQAIRKSFDLGWSGKRILSNVSVSVSAALKPAGLEKSKGLIAAQWGKDPGDARWNDDPGMKQFRAFCEKYLNAASYFDYNVEYGYGNAITLAAILKSCGDDLSRENILKCATHIDSLESPTLLPGMKLHTKPGSYSALREMQLSEFDGASWRLFGELIEA
jgi:ABC-type branched-subunit amino acid transport system substrate-binding protein